MIEDLSLGFFPKIKAVDVSSHIFDMLVKNNMTQCRTRVHSNIPEDAKLEYVFWMPEKEIIRLIYSHSDFERVPFLGKHMHDYRFMQSEIVTHSVDFD